MEKEHLKKLKELLLQQQELFKIFEGQCQEMETLGHEEDDEVELKEYNVATKAYKVDMNAFMNEINTKDKVLHEIVEREELKKTFRLIK